MAQANSSTVSFIYKTVYSGKKPENLASRDRVLLSMMPKEGGFTGDNFVYAIQYGNNQGVSSNFGNAQTNADTTKGTKVTLTRARKYGVGTIDLESAAAAGDDKGAFVRLVTSQMDSTVDELGHRLAIALYNDGSGSIGRCANDPTDAGGPITLTNPDDARNFFPGQVIQANPTKTGTAGNMRVGTGTVTLVDEDAGSITYSGTITAITTNDYLYNQGDYDGDVAGLDAWIPLTTPGATPFFGMVRNVSPQRLGGWRVTTGGSIEENSKKLAAKIRRAGGRPKAMFLSPMNWNTLQNSLASKVERPEGGDAKYGYEYISLATPAGMIKCYADPECPPDRGYILDMSTWKLRYLGDGVPHVADEDGLRMLRGATTDSVEYRFRYWGNLYCTAPGYNGVFQIF
jgi:hypothetical protein